MKTKVFLLLSTLIIALTSFKANVKANTYYDQVNVKTTFEENIDLKDINEIEIHLEDATEYSKDYILKKDDNFSLTIDSVPVGPYKFLYGVVIDDKIGYYNVLATVNTDNENNQVLVQVNVKKNENNSNNRTTTSNSNDNDVIVLDDEKNTTDEKKETTTIPAAVEEARRKEEQERLREENRRKNGLIGKIMFVTIGIVLLILIIYASIKISNANK